MANLQSGCDRLIKPVSLYSSEHVLVAQRHNKLVVDVFRRIGTQNILNRRDQRHRDTLFKIIKGNGVLSQGWDTRVKRRKDLRDLIGRSRHYKTPLSTRFAPEACIIKPCKSLHQVLKG